jgi:hypothetical protein
VTGDWMDIDYINFVKGKDAEDSDPIGGPSALGNKVAFKALQYTTYRVFGLNGAMLGKVDLNGANVSEALKAAGYKKGVYMLQQVEGGKKFMAKVTK